MRTSGAIALQCISEAFELFSCHYTQFGIRFNSIEQFVLSIGASANVRSMCVMLKCVRLTMFYHHRYFTTNPNHDTVTQPYPEIQNFQNASHQGKYI